MFGNDVDNEIPDRAVIVFAVKGQNKLELSPRKVASAKAVV